MSYPVVVLNVAFVPGEGYNRLKILFVHISERKAGMLLPLLIYISP